MRIQSFANQPKNTFIYSNPNLNFRSDNLSVESLEEKNNTKIKEKTHMTSNIAIATIASVGCLLMFSRGFQKNAGKYLNKFKEYLEGKLEHSTLDKSNKKTKFIEYSIRSINSFLKKSESINNITSLKDILFMKLMYKTEPTKKVHTSITKYFEKLSRKTVTNSYKKTEEYFNRMNKIFDDLDKQILKNSPDEIIEYKGVKYTKRQLVEMASSYREDATIVVKAFTDEKPLQARYDYINDVTATLYSRFWDSSFKDFWSKENKFKRKEMWQTFIAAEQIKGNKTQLGKNVSAARNIISYDEQDKTSLIQEYIKNLDGLIPQSDKDGLRILDKLNWYAKHTESLKENKDLIFEELKNLRNHSVSENINKNVVKAQEEYKKMNIDLIQHTLDDFDSSAIKDMLSIYHRIAPLELSQSRGDLAVKNAVKSFDKSVNLEMVEFFDKVRDLRLGSAPTDVLTVVMTFIMLSFGFGYAKDKDERASIMYKSGIPIVGAIATSLITATKLVSGGKSLAFGFISGIILNKLGTIVDDIRKTHNKKSEQ